MSLSSLSSLSDPEEYNPRRRQFPSRENVLSNHEGEEFRTRYRVSKEVVIQLCEKLALEPMTKRNKPIDGLTQLLICLRFYATGTLQQVLSEITNIHKSTVCRIVQRVTQKLAELAHVYIKMPNCDELGRVAEDFYEIQGFPYVAGAIGCSQVKIVSRLGSFSELYRCSKNYFSINIQVVCDTDFKIRDIIARWPGSVPADTIFNNSHLCADFENGRYENYLLLGDNSYTNKNYLLTPISQPQTFAEEAYNASHIATLNTVKRCFEVWKQRCPCLEKGITLNKTSTILQVIVACAVLHNMCIDLNEARPPNDFQPDDYLSGSSYMSAGADQEQTIVRTALINATFS